MAKRKNKEWALVVYSNTLDKIVLLHPSKKHGTGYWYAEGLNGHAIYYAKWTVTPISKTKRYDDIELIGEFD